MFHGMDRPTVPDALEQQAQNKALQEHTLFRAASTYREPCP